LLQPFEIFEGQSEQVEPLSLLRRGPFPEAFDEHWFVDVVREQVFIALEEVGFCWELWVSVVKALLHLSQRLRDF
jgi:hypothetical protein